MSKVCWLNLGVLFAIASSPAFGWGELGHSVIGRVAAKLVGSTQVLADLKASGLSAEDKAHLSSFTGALSSKWLQQGLVANIPDIYWRNLDQNLQEEGTLLGDSAHFLNAEHFLPLSLQPGTETAPDDLLGFFQVQGTKDPLNYDDARTLFAPNIAANGNTQAHDFFHGGGSVPWRAQQFASLYSWALTHSASLQSSYQNAVDFNTDLEKNGNPGGQAKVVVPPPAETIILAYAGLMSHMTGDASQPYHVTVNYDGDYTRQHGLHAYFETTVLNEIGESTLLTRVTKRTLQLFASTSDAEPSVHHFHSLVSRFFPQAASDDSLAKNGVTALTLSLAADSMTHTGDIAALDLKYAIATLAEAEHIPMCQHLSEFKSLEGQLAATTDEDAQDALLQTKVLSPAGGGKEAACRRSPWTKVDQDGNPSSDPSAKRVADWYADLVVDRLAAATAVTADIWARLWIQSGKPKLDFTFIYALKPSFVSPTDATCFGYASHENPAFFQRLDHTSVLHVDSSGNDLWVGSPSSTEDCVKF